MTIDDLYELKIVDEPCVDPAGVRVAFTVTALDREADEYRSQIWIWDSRGGGLIRLTSGEHRDSRPQWSPDGSQIAFISKREDADDARPQIHLISVHGGEPEQLTTVEFGVDAFEWSPDGSRMLFVSSTPEREERDTDVRLITTARFRGDGSGYYDDRFKQIYVLDVATRRIRQLTEGPFDHVQATWSPGGNEIAFVSNRSEGWEFSQVRDIYLVKAESGIVRRLTDGSGQWSLPSWSSDGSQLVAYGTRRLDSGSPRNELFRISLTGAQPESLTSDLDVDFRDASISDWNGYPFGPAVWIGDDELLTVASVRGLVRPVTLDMESGNLQYRAPEAGRFGNPRPLHDGTLVATYTDFVEPGELVQLGPDGSSEQLTHFNDQWLDEVELSMPERLGVTSPDGIEVSGWLLRPPGLDEDEAAPLLLEIHGGPFGMYADTFMHEFHLLAAQGYAVLFMNPRGSAGHGDEFAELLLPEMGENDLPDLIAALDAVVEKPGIDGDRLGVLGGSYGGFMTNWVIAHTGRFRAAVTQRTISDWFSAWGTDDIFFADGNVTFGATPWENPELYYRLSPITYVDQMETPLLIIHSEEDYRCPISQSEELFTALMRLGRETEFVRIPDESHGLSRTGKPGHRVTRLEHILRWFDLHL